MSLGTGLLNQKITSIYSTSENEYGDKTNTVYYSEVPCAWQSSVSKKTDKDSRETEYKVVAWIGPDYDDVEEDWAVLKSGKTYTIVEKFPMYDLDGNLDHLELHLR